MNLRIFNLFLYNKFFKLKITIEEKSDQQKNPYGVENKIIMGKIA